MQLPSNVKPGDYGLSHSESTAGRWIRIGQILNGSGFADYEHAFVYVGDGKIVEATGNGAVLVPYHYAPKDVYWSSDKIPLTDEQRTKIVNAAKSYVGVPYSPEDYFALALRRFHIPAPHLRQYISDTRHMICSQLVDKCYEDAGVHLFNDGRWNGYVTPGDLWQILQRPT
jgi:cell wall-associated NlpC family hydrolase